VSSSDSDRRGAGEGERTRAIHGPAPNPGGAASIPIYHSSTFGAPTLEAMNAENRKHAAGAFYQRYGNPTVHACETRLAALEGGEAALLFPSGMAAIASAFLTVLRAGDHVVGLHQSYGGTLELLGWGEQRLGWSVTLVDVRDPASWGAAFRPETRLLHVESPTNPIVSVVDLAAAASLAHAHGALLSVDNTFASPVGQQPLALGADLSLYSATKSIGGHGDLMAGVAIGSRERIEQLWHVRKVFGPVPEPGLAWQVERSLKTLPIRLDAMNASAAELARRLAAHSQVKRVFYPGLPGHPGHEVAKRQMRHGFGHVLAVEVPGGADAGRALIEAFRIVRLAPSLGSVESLASIPAFTSHIHLGPEGRARVGIPEGVVRVSVGLEDVEDLWSDFEQAIAHAVPAGAERVTSGRSS
jgi:cystathionine beta-lyase/cystathionine gamma-synthase